MAQMRTVRTSETETLLSDGLAHTFVQKLIQRSVREIGTRRPPVLTGRRRLIGPRMNTVLRNGRYSIGFPLYPSECPQYALDFKYRKCPFLNKDHFFNLR